MRFPNMIMFWSTISGTKSLLALTKLALRHSSRPRPVIPRHICQFAYPVHNSDADVSCSQRNSKSLSTLVGYAAIDGDATWIVPLASYLSCDPSGSNSGNDVIDIFGLNN